MSAFNIIPLLVLLGSLTAILVIIIRKFPQLAALNVEEIPQFIQARKKDELLIRRLQRVFHGKGKKMRSTLLPLVHGWAKLQHAFRASYQRTYDSYVRYKEKLERESAKRLEPRDAVSLLEEAEALVKEERLDLAEQKFINIIKVDPKNIEAYRGLGRLYMDLEKYPEAREIFQFIVKRAADDGRAWNRLGMIEMAEGKYEDAAHAFRRAVEINFSIAVRHFDLGRALTALEQKGEALVSFKKAAELEPQNPRYLDAAIEAAIIEGDRPYASETLVRLQEVNPENQKIDEFADRISQMKKSRPGRGVPKSGGSV